MENPNTLFNTWMDVQNKMTKNMVEMNEKLQKTMIGGEMMEKGSELYKEWLEKQKGLLNNLVNQTANGSATAANATENTTNNPADFFQNWMNTQNEAMKNWMETTRTFTENMMKGQTGAFNPWANAQNMPNNFMGGLNNMFGANNMFSGLNKAMADMPKFMNPTTAKEAFDDLLKGTQTYAKMYEMWQPFFQNMPKTGALDMDAMKKMFDPAAYKGLIDQMFGFTSNNNLTELFEQTSKTVSNMFASSRQMGDSMRNMFDKERDLMEGMMPFGSNYVSEMYKTMFNNFRQGMLPFFRISAPGKENEQLDKMFVMQEKLVNYSVKQNEMQYLIYANASTALTEVMNILKNRSEEQKEYTNFQEFYGEWASVNEKIFIELFSTEEFSRLQGELIGLGLDLKKGFEEQMEAMLEPLPVVLKSQMEEVYRTNYDLRKELRNLQKTVKEMQKNMENGTTEATKTAKAAAAKK